MRHCCLQLSLCSQCSLCSLVISFLSFKDHATLLPPAGYNLFPFYNHLFFHLSQSIVSFFPSFLLKCTLPQIFIFLHLSIVLVPHAGHLVSKINETHSQAFSSSFPTAPDRMPSMQKALRNI